ncbi:S49 family peptidase [Arcicella sp. LKC2W]|uniref:S49 family peptidase n=1 Tax=Arcicella sp. LKC2W TaxID=2984198 RepID=UPI002B1F1A54|nr:S49 family peptidase [Arcicella sp. LKC2W]MEA5458680.1 S49 family peptidase [Arcicella sp. LKC2W]
MNTGILDINPAVAENYLDILHGKIQLSNKAVDVHSEIITVGDTNTEGEKADSIDKVLNSIDIVPVRGPVQRGNIFNRNNDVAVWGMDWVSDTIIRLANDSKNVALILEFETGGGYSNSVASVIDAIKFYKSKGKKTYASVDMACSAGYHIAVFADAIYANSRSSVFGCMGTKWEGVNSSAIDKRIGYQEITVTSDMTPDKNREFSEALNGKPQLLKDHLINPIGQHFVDDVTTNRPSINREMIKGATVTAEIAIKNGMADGILSIKQIIDGIANDNLPANSSSTPTKTPPVSNSKPNNTMKNISLLGWTLSKSAGTSTPEMDEQAIKDISELENFKSTYGLEKQGFVDKVISLESALETEKQARATDAQTIADLNSRLEKTTGTPPKQPADATGDAQNPIENSQKHLEMDDMDKQFHNDVKASRSSVNYLGY